MASAFTLNVRLDNVAVVTIDMPREKTNTLETEFAFQVRAILKHIHDNKVLRDVVFISAKPGNFIAGAGINTTDNCRSTRETETLARRGQQMMVEINALLIPVIATIHDTCLDGSLEMALACHNRICTDDVKTILGLPEIQLGLLPSSGDAQRLPRLISVSTVLDMILTRKQLHAGQALEVGLMDKVILRSILLGAAAELAKKGSSVHQTLPVRERVLTGSLGRALLSHMANKKTAQKTQDNYPATERILEVIETGLAQGNSSGYDAEARAFDELTMISQSQTLRHTFFVNTDVREDPGSDVGPGPLNGVGILRGNLMSGDIAYMTTCKSGLPVHIKNINAKGINHALKYSWDQLETRVRRHHIKASEHGKQLALIPGSIDYRGFAHCDLIIKAVPENLSLKQRMVAEIGQSCVPHTIFASNTSSLSIGNIAVNAARPEQVIGLHFFGPVEKIPLAEVIPHTMTSKQTITTTAKLAKEQGKTSIVVRNKAGFYANRILTPYASGAIHMLTEGERVETMDAALVKFGFPIRPIQLLDEVGVDTDTKTIPVSEVAYREHFSTPASVVASILNDDRKGRKGGRGFYLYGMKGRKSKKQVDPAICTLIGIQGRGRLTAVQIAERRIMLMLSEAAHCFGERIVRSARNGDTDAVSGIGFSPSLGGPFRYMGSLGAGEMVAILQRLITQYGSWFTPCEQLLRVAERSEGFWNIGETDLNS